MAGQVQHVGDRRLRMERSQGRLVVQQCRRPRKEWRERADLITHPRHLCVGEAKQCSRSQWATWLGEAVAQHARTRRIADLAALDHIACAVVERMKRDIVQYAVRYHYQPP